MRSHNLLGQKFNMLTVIKKLESRPRPNKKGRDCYWLCVCECGKECETTTYKLRAGQFKSCGCLRDGEHSGTNSIISKYRNKSKRRGLEFDFTTEEFREIMYGNCYYCNAEPKNKFRKDKYNGVDRVNNSIGYTKQNSVTCCKICNIMKSVLSIDEFYSHLTRIYNKRIK